jgi:hypothetical protein
MRANIIGGAGGANPLPSDVIGAFSQQAFGYISSGTDVIFTGKFTVQNIYKEHHIKKWWAIRNSSRTLV